MRAAGPRGGTSRETSGEPAFMSSSQDGLLRNKHDDLKLNIHLLQGADGWMDWATKQLNALHDHPQTRL